MGNGEGIKQPTLGLIGAVVTIGLSLAISTAFHPDTFGTWVGFLVMCAVPTQIVIALVWQNRYPGVLARLPQPERGTVILAILVGVAGVLAPATLYLVGGGVTPPTPFLNMYIILTVVATIWLVVVFQCWPAAAISAHPAAVGLGTLGFAYLSAWVVFQTGFDFQSMAAAPFYVATLDPHGAIPAWNILSYAVTTVAVIMSLVLLDFWPFSALAAKAPVLGRQPLFGLTVGAVVLLVAAFIWTAGVRLVGMDVVDYLVRVPVSFVFGTFILLTLFQSAPFQRMAQPAKGMALIVGSAVLAVVTYCLYRFTALAMIGEIPVGPPTYGLDLWIATAMLSITFPTIVAFGDGFGFWPFVRTAKATSEIALESA